MRTEGEEGRVQFIAFMGFVEPLNGIELFRHMHRAPEMRITEESKWKWKCQEGILVTRFGTAFFLVLPPLPKIGRAHV